MEFTVGTILEGTVTGITKFGAFVSLPENKTGMVHISQVAYTYVNDINEHLKIGQQVKVRVIGIDPNGKINLSIKKAMDPPARNAQTNQKDRGQGGRKGQNDRGTRPQKNPARWDDRRQSRTAAKEPQTFDDMLKQFMADSDNKISSIKQYSDHRTKSKRRQ